MEQTGQSSGCDKWLLSDKKVLQRIKTCSPRHSYSKMKKVSLNKILSFKSPLGLLSKVQHVTHQPQLSLKFLCIQKVKEEKKTRKPTNRAGSISIACLPEWKWIEELRFIANGHEQALHHYYISSSNVCALCAISQKPGKQSEWTFERTVGRKNFQKRSITFLKDIFN